MCRCFLELLGTKLLVVGEYVLQLCELVDGPLTYLFSCIESLFERIKQFLGRLLPSPSTDYWPSDPSDQDESDPAALAGGPTSYRSTGGHHPIALQPVSGMSDSRQRQTAGSGRVVYHAPVTAPYNYSSPGRQAVNQPTALDLSVRNIPLQSSYTSRPYNSHGIATRTTSSFEPSATRSTVSMNVVPQVSRTTAGLQQSHYLASGQTAAYRTTSPSSPLLQTGGGYDTGSVELWSVHGRPTDQYRFSTGNGMSHSYERQTWSPSPAPQVLSPALDAQQRQSPAYNDRQNAYTLQSSASASTLAVSSQQRLSSAGVTRRGLVNRGNACFVNCVLQSLAAIDDLLAELHHHQQQQRGGDELVASLADVLSAVRQPGDQPVHLDRLLGVVGGLLRASGQSEMIDVSRQRQQDAAEFLMSLLNLLRPRLVVETSTPSTDRQSTLSLCLSVSLSVCICLCLSVSLSLCLSLSLSLSLSVCLSVRLSVGLCGIHVAKSLLMCSNFVCSICNLKT